MQQYPHETHEMTLGYPRVAEPSAVKTHYSFFSAGGSPKPRPNVLKEAHHFMFCPVGRVTWGSTHAEEMTTATQRREELKQPSLTSQTLSTPAHQPNRHNALQLRTSTFGVGFSRLIALGVGKRSNVHLPCRSGGVRREKHHLRLAEVMPGFANAKRLCVLF